jgi:hypothetical protein
MYKLWLRHIQRAQKQEAQENEQSVSTLVELTQKAIGELQQDLCDIHLISISTTLIKLIDYKFKSGLFDVDKIQVIQTPPPQDTPNMTLLGGQTLELGIKVHINVYEIIQKHFNKEVRKLMIFIW